MYDFYKEYCICPACTVYLGLRDENGEEVGGWPVTVYNVNDVAIGTANNKEQYMALWNADSANAAIGRLSGLIGPYSFTLEGKCRGFNYLYLGKGGILIDTQVSGGYKIKLEDDFSWLLEDGGKWLLETDGSLGGGTDPSTDNSYYDNYTN